MAVPWQGPSRTFCEKGMEQAGVSLSRSSGEQGYDPCGAWRLVGLVPAVTISYTALPCTGLFQGLCVNDQTFFHNNLAERWG